MKSINSFINETTMSRIKEMYDDDLDNTSTSEALTIAIEEFPHLIGSILRALSLEAAMEAVEALRDSTYCMYVKQEYDNVSDDITSIYCQGE
jgi:hypothetical protein